MLTVKDLTGEPVTGIGRAAAMVWLSFGPLREVETRRGKRTVSALALHLDCPWRLRRSDRPTVVLGWADLFEPSPAHAEDRSFDWDIQGNNLFDAQAEALFAGPPAVYVLDASLSPLRDLTVTFSNGLTLECFLHGTARAEYWRLFRPFSHGGDLIVTGQGLETYP